MLSPPGRKKNGKRKTERHRVERMNLVVIGAGPAGWTAAKKIRMNDPGSRVLIFDAGKDGFYAKIRLPEYLAGKLERKRLLIASPEQMAASGVEVHTDEKIVSFDPVKKTILSGDGREYGYDKLILATGASARLPSVPGMESTARVLTLRKIEDADAIAGFCTESGRALVLGGGLLGLEAAAALKERGMNVVILECQNRLLPRQLTEKESAFLYEEFQARGFTVKLGVNVKRVEAQPGKSTGVASSLPTENPDASLRAELDSGEILEADLMLVSAGIQSETALAAAAGLKVQRGIVVDDTLRTSAPDVYAIGDCAELNGTVAGLWVAAKDQGEALGEILCGKRASFASPPYSPQLKIPGIDLNELRRKASASGNGEGEGA